MASSSKQADPLVAIGADIAAEDLKPVYLLFGQESFLARQAYDALWQAALGSGPRGFNDQVFQGGKASGADIAGAAAHLPMMAPKRVIVVRKAEKLKADDVQRLGEYCSNPSPTTVLILLGSDGERKVVDGRSKLAKSIKKQGRWCEFKKLYSGNLRSWIEGAARGMGKRLDPSGPGYLEAVLGNDLSQIHNGLRHASLFVGDAESIRLEDLEEVISGRKQEALWDMLDALGQRRLEEVLRNMQLLCRQGEKPIAVLSLAKRRMRQLMDAERAMARGASRRDALLQAGIPPNMSWKYEHQLGNYSLRELARASSRLLKAESDLKGGLRIDARWTVERAITDVVAG